MTNLHVLRLRGVSGLALPTFSFSGGLSALESLKNLRKLALTSLRDIPCHEFSFLSQLTQLESLEIGDCNRWSTETYQLLSKQINLQRLRLERSGSSPVNALGDALICMSRLNQLELIMFNINEVVGLALRQLKELQSISLLPDLETNAAEVNAQTFNAIKDLAHLKKLDWGFIQDSKFLESGVDNVKNKEIIPFLISDGIDYSDDTPKEIAMLSVAHLIDKLSKHLSRSKIRVIQLPKSAAVKFSQSFS